MSLEEEHIQQSQKQQKDLAAEEVPNFIKE